MNELEIVDQLRAKFRIRNRGIVIGIGDDCAIFRPAGSREDLVFSTDQVIGGVHFRSGAPARRTGAKAVARAVSDLAAMGADPRFCMISLSAPKSFDISGFFAGVGKAAERLRLTVAGGDLAKSPGITCDVIVCGSVPRGKALLRSTARSGDGIYVSGPLGRAAARGYREIPEPRLRFGRSLRGRATACMDVSDGLSTDLFRLCRASGTGAFLHHIPQADGASVEQALHGGEDYELLYTGADLPGIRIGVMNSEPPGLVTLDGYPIPPGGWDHFA